MVPGSVAIWYTCIQVVESLETFRGDLIATEPKLKRAWHF